MYVQFEIVSGKIHLGSFSHSTDQLRERPNLTKTKMCALVESGEECLDGDNCPYAHAINELRATPMLYKTVLCSWWKKGQCEFGSSCRFAHGEDQLRDGSAPSSVQSPGQLPSPSPTPRNGSLSAASSVPHSLNTLMSTTASVVSPTGSVRMGPSSDFVTPSPVYATIFSASLAAATTAALQSGVSVLSAQQTAAIAAAAAAAASEAMKHVPGHLTPVLESSQPSSSQADAMMHTFKKGFASSPALLGFFDDSDEHQDALVTEWVPENDVGYESGHHDSRPRSDSDPGLKVTERLMEEIRKLWTDGTSSNSLGQSAPQLSASHATLDGYHVNLD